MKKDLLQRGKQDFFHQVLSDNKADQSSALSILYHVAESYQDKTPFSASRWVWESVAYGAHRLGHCIALGMDPEYFKGCTRTEGISERIDQMQWELNHYDEILNFGEFYSKQEIESKLKYYQNSIESEKLVEIQFDEKTMIYLKTMQDYILNYVKLSDAVIESCPSSNYYIGMIHNATQHPLKRFVANKVKVTIGSDDPGIFDTSLVEEYSKAGEIGLSTEELETIRKNSFNYKSSILSGRIKSS